MSDKVQFLKKFNQAFVVYDVEYILDQFTDDIHWEMIGDQLIEGKKAAAEMLKNMKPDLEMKLEVDHIITQEDLAAVDGTITMSNGKTISFCDVYEFSGSEKLKIKKMRSYIFEH